MLCISFIHSFTFLNMIDDTHLSHDFDHFLFYKFTNVHLYILLLSHLTFIILAKHARVLYRINLVGISQMSSSLVVFFYFYLTFILCLSYTKLQSIRAFSLLLHSWFICMHAHMLFL
jgi:hypothetical protein